MRGPDLPRPRCRIPGARVCLVGMMLFTTGVTLASQFAGGAAPSATAPAVGGPATPRARTGTGAQLFELLGLQQWAAAESLANAELARLHAEPSPDSLAVADALFTIGWARMARLNLKDGVALQAASRALGLRARRSADPLDVARAHDLMGRLLDYRGSTDTALVHLRRVVEIRTAQLGPADTLVANAWYRLAMARRNTFEMGRTLDEFGQALAIRERVHGPRHPVVSDILSEMGYCLAASGEMDSARSVLERSLDGLARTVGRDSRRCIAALDYLAGVELFLGEAGRALDLSYEALRVAQLHFAADHSEVLRMRRNLANLLYTVRDYSGMRVILEALLPWYESHYGPTAPRTTNVRLDLGVAYAQLGDSAAALPMLREVERTLAARPGPPDANLAWAIIRQSELLQQSGDNDGARAAYERAIRAERSRPQPSAYTLVTLHAARLNAQYAQGDAAGVDSTARLIAQLAEANQLMETPVGPRVRMCQALAADGKGRSQEAWTRATESFQQALDQTRASLRSLPERAALGLSQDLTMPLELVLHFAGEASSSRLPVAWDCLVRARGLVRAEMTRRQLPAELRGVPTVVAKHSAWRKAQRRYAQALVNSRGAQADAAQLQQLRGAAEVAESAYRVELAARQGPNRAADAGLEEVLARLTAGQALVSFVELSEPTDEPRMLVFVAYGDRSELARIDLGSAQVIDNAVRAWQDQLAAPPRADARGATDAERRCRELGRTVRALTWDRIRAHLQNARDVYLVADGSLLDLPWQALPDKQRAYLVETGPRLHVLNAEWELAAEMARPAAAAMLAVGDPDYQAAPPGAPGQTSADGPIAITMRLTTDPCATQGASALERLPASRVEAEEAAQTWRSSHPNGEATLLIGAQATEAAVKLSAPGRAMLHLATHGIVARDTCKAGGTGLRGVGGVSPLGAPTAQVAADRVAGRRLSRDVGRSPWADRRVWLALAGANQAPAHTSDENEGLLTAEEVVTLDLRGVEWVVLSACHSGAGEAWSSEGTLGMRRAFHLAGARCVLASQWAVEDAAARDWMRALYQARAEGESSAGAALQAAGRAVLEQRRRAGQTTHPFYWASFTATGN